MVRKLFTLTVIMILSFISISPAQSKATPRIITVKESIVKHSIEMGIDPALGLSIAKLESGFCHEKRSSFGAVGVFQLMPQTAARLGYNPYHLNDNIRGGLMYYKMMYKMFGSVELALAAYNAGPGNVKKYRGVPPFSETKRFVSNIMNEYNYQKVNPDPILRQYKRAPHNAIQKPNPSKIERKLEPIALEQDNFLDNFMLTQAI